MRLRVDLRLRLRVWRFSVGGFEVESVSVWVCVWVGGLVGGRVGNKCPSHTRE